MLLICFRSIWPRGMEEPVKGVHYRLLHVPALRTHGWGSTSVWCGVLYWSNWIYFGTPDFIKCQWTTDTCKTPVSEYHIFIVIHCHCHCNLWNVPPHQQLPIINPNHNISHSADKYSCSASLFPHWWASPYNDGNTWVQYYHAYARITGINPDHSTRWPHPSVFARQHQCCGLSA